MERAAFWLKIWWIVANAMGCGKSLLSGLASKRQKTLGKMPGLRQIDIGPVRWRMVTIALGPFDIPVDCPPMVNQDFLQELLFYLYRNTPLKSSLKAKLISIRREVQQYIYHEFY
jgi:hypothetical protein